MTISACSGRLRATAFTCVPLAALTALATPAFARAADPAAILQAEDYVSYSGVLQIDGGQKIRIWHAPKQRQRQEFLAPDGSVGDVLVSDGRIRWHAMTASGTRAQNIKVVPLDAPFSLRKRLQLLKQNYQFQHLGEAVRAGRRVELVRFTPRHLGNLTHMLWVDRATRLPLAIERRDENGRLVDRSEYLKITFQPQLSEASFAFRIPDGARVTSTLTQLAHGDAGASPSPSLPFRPALPQALPSGYELLSWQVLKSQHQVTTFNWRLHDGLNPLSLFAVPERSQARLPSEARAVALKSGQGYWLQHGANRSLFWTAQGAAYTLVGHLPEAEMLKVANSLL